MDTLEPARSLTRNLAARALVRTAQMGDTEILALVQDFVESGSLHATGSEDDSAMDLDLAFGEIIYEIAAANPEISPGWRTRGKE